jgi:ADP-heptose:LPS heptosyltransferase
MNGDGGVPAARSGERVPGVRRIAVLRANRLGDFISILPALEALAAAYPQAEIVLLGRPWHRRFLLGRAGPVARTLVIPAVPGLHEPAPRERAEVPDPETFLAAAHREAFDLALQLHGGGRESNRFVKRLRARVTAGSKTEDASPLDRCIPYDVLQPEIARYLEIAGLVGAPPVTLQPRLAVLARDLEEAQEWIDGGAYVLLHPGATDPRRRWPPEYFGRVGDALAAHGYRVIINAIGEEAAIAARVVAAMRAPAEIVRDGLSVSGLLGLIARAAAVVSNDSGPMHLAVAAGTPCIGLFWFFNAITSAPPSRARFAPLVSWRSHCPNCGRNLIADVCDHMDSVIAGISPDDVIDSALSLISAGATNARGADAAATPA